jgi:recombinational DNA repair ATPase RecF
MDPAYRRNYLNQAISSQNRLYLDLLRTYTSTLEQKNALLKQERAIDESLFTILNERLALEGAKIIRQRLEFLQ